MQVNPKEVSGPKANTAGARRQQSLAQIVDEPEKQCRRCGEHLPIDKEFFFTDKRSADGLRSVCKACYYEQPSVVKRQKRGADHAH